MVMYGVTLTLDEGVAAAAGFFAGLAAFFAGLCFAFAGDAAFLGVACFLGDGADLAAAAARALRFMARGGREGKDAFAPRVATVFEPAQFSFPANFS